MMPTAHHIQLGNLGHIWTQTIRLGSSQSSNWSTHEDAVFIGQLAAINIAQLDLQQCRLRGNLLIKWLKRRQKRVENVVLLLNCKYFQMIQTWPASQSWQLDKSSSWSTSSDMSEDFKWAMISDDLSIHSKINLKQISPAQSYIDQTWIPPTATADDNQLGKKTNLFPESQSSSVVCGGAALEQPHVFWEANELKVFFSISVSLQPGLIYMETTCSSSSTGYAMSLQPTPQNSPTSPSPQTHTTRLLFPNTHAFSSTVWHSFGCSSLYLSSITLVFFLT